MTRIFLAVTFVGIGVLVSHSFPSEFKDVWYFLFTAALWVLALSLLISFFYDLLKRKRLN